MKKTILAALLAVTVVSPAFAGHYQGNTGCSQVNTTKGPRLSTTTQERETRVAYRENRSWRSQDQRDQEMRQDRDRQSSKDDMNKSS